MAVSRPLPARAELCTSCSPSRSISQREIVEYERRHSTPRATRLALFQSLPDQSRDAYLAVACKRYRSRCVSQPVAAPDCVKLEKRAIPHFVPGEVDVMLDTSSIELVGSRVGHHRSEQVGTLLIRRLFDALRLWPVAHGDEHHHAAGFAVHKEAPGGRTERIEGLPRVGNPPLHAGQLPRAVELLFPARCRS